ncbi:MAG: type II toxin-antitoxin system death-on-curing family toxin [Pseudomonadota bacterium]|nr:type II toxin-antitoxin system death-on-curing family toxin [Pseudomonadota bacterium]
MLVWIDRALAQAIHERQLGEHGGIVGIRDEGLLDSALAKPQQLDAYGEPPPDLAALAASLAFDIARNHPFLDGNKRTAHVCYRVFLQLNGMRLQAEQEDKYLAMLQLAEGSWSEDEFAGWLRPRLYPLTRISEP